MISKNHVSDRLLSFLKDLGFGEHERPFIKDLKARWKELCRKHHPDAGGDQKEFLKVTHAYKMLTDSEYQHKHFVEEARRKAGSGNLLRDLDIVITMPIRFEDGFFGRKITVSFASFELTEDLEVVDGKAETQAVSVTVPSGTLQNYQQFYGGKGHRRGDSVGDVTLTLLVKPHPVFRFENWDIVSRMPVQLDVLLRGGKIDVQTMYGLVTARVPPGTKPGSRITIKNHGVNRVGCHLVEVEPVYPSKDELKNNKEWKGLKIDWGEHAEEDTEEKDLLKLFTRGGGSGTIFTFTSQG